MTETDDHLSDSSAEAPARQPRQSHLLLRRLMRAIQEQNWFVVALELLIVVIGVLVALAVNEWNADRHDRASEAEHLGAILSELRRDSLVLANHLRPWIVEANEALPDVRAVTSGARPVPSDTLGFVRTVITSHMWIAMFPGNGTTVEMLLATGDLGVIQSRSLRAGLLAYYELQGLHNTLSSSELGEYPRLVRGFIPESGESDISAIPDSVLRAHDVVGLVEAIRTPEFRQAANRHTAYLRTTLRLLGEMQDTASSLIGEIEAELERSR